MAIETSERDSTYTRIPSHKITGSAVHAIGICDGYILSRLLLPSQKLLKAFINKGRSFHQAIADVPMEPEPELVESGLFDAEEDEEPSEEEQAHMMEVAKSRPYFKNRVAFLTEKELTIEKISPLGIIHLGGTPDTCSFDREANHLFVIDWKTSRLISARDIIQLKTYILLIIENLDAIADGLGLSYEAKMRLTISGIVDYVDIDRQLTVICPPDQVAEHRKWLVQETGRLEQMIVSIVHGIEPRVEYSASGLCTMGSLRGVCPEYRKSATAAHNFVDSAKPVPEAITVDTPALLAEFEDVKGLIKLLTLRAKALQDAILLRGKAGLMETNNRYSVIATTRDYFVDSVFKERFLPALQQYDHTTVLQAVGALFREATVVLKKDAAEKLPDWIKDIALKSFTQNPSKPYVKPGSKKKNEKSKK